MELNYANCGTISLILSRRSRYIWLHGLSVRFSFKFELHFSMVFSLFVLVVEDDNGFSFHGHLLPALA